MSEEAKEKSQKLERVAMAVWGLISLSLGVLFTLDYAGLVQAGRPWQYWPLVLIGLGLPGLIAPRNDDDAGWGLALTAVGTLFLLPKLRLAGPILLILLGLVLVVGAWPGWGRAGRRASDPDGR